MSTPDLLTELASSLPDLVPADLLEVERDRTIGDRLAGRPGRAIAVRLTGPELVLHLRVEGSRVTGEALHEVRGVVISRRTVTTAQWLDLLAGQLRILTARSAADTDAVGRTLRQLGVVEPAADVVVDERDPAGGLRALPGRLAGRVPPDVQDVVSRICAVLLDTLPRLSGDGADRTDHTVRRTATDYLPRTLRTYLALPPDWASGHRLPDGRTPLDELRAQLSGLEQAVAGLRDAVLAGNARDLEANGAFLRDTFDA